ncbi:MAG TPA: uridylate kinase [Hyphomicrobium sp.]|nr:uridylate kinase [Hyphomicrobium sp.]
MADGKPQKAAHAVIKVGGSLAETGRLRGVLELITKATRPVIVVPGGGQFADKVRDLQTVLRFNDAFAHRLAILGMHQMAEVFFAMQPRLAPADSPEGIARVLAVGHIPVWLPWQMCQDDKDIPADWTITSDGLAARLAERLGGLEVVLLKSVTAQAGCTTQDLAEEGIVDRAFPVIVARAHLPWQVLGPRDEAALARLIGAPHS